MWKNVVSIIFIDASARISERKSDGGYAVADFRLQCSLSLVLWEGLFRAYLQMP